MHKKRHKRGKDILKILLKVTEADEEKEVDGAQQ
jgi:hypothetical protein